MENLEVRLVPLEAELTLYRACIGEILDSMFGSAGANREKFLREVMANLHRRLDASETAHAHEPLALQVHELARQMADALARDLGL